MVEASRPKGGESVSDNEMIVMIIGRYRMNDVEVYCWISLHLKFMFFAALKEVSSAKRS